MTISDDRSGPMLRAPGEPCAACGSPLASDQRYCLECGTRQGAPRLDPLTRARGDSERDHIRATAEAQPAWASLPPAALALGRPRVTAVAAAGVLAFGALIGASAAPAPENASAGPVYLAGSAPRAAPATTTAPSASSEASSEADVSSGVAGDDAAAASELAVPADTPAATQPSAKQESGSDEEQAPDAESPPAIVSPAPVKHVWVISLDGVDIAAAATPTAAAAQVPAGTAPTPEAAFTDLVGSGTLLSSYASVTRGSLANSIALVSGLEPTPAQRQNCPAYSAVTPGNVAEKTGLVTGDGCVEPPQALTLADRLTGAGLVWRAYAEDIGAGSAEQSSCRHPALGQADPFAAPRPGDAYLTWRNPFVYFRSITESADCGTAVVGLDRLVPDLETVSGAPALSYVIPNACHDGGATSCADGAPAGPAAALTWLGTIVPQIQASPVYADGGLVVVTSADGPRPGPASTGGVPVGALLLSPYVAAGTTITTAYDHLSLLRTLSAIFGVPAPARAAGEKVKPFGAQVFANAPAPGDD